METHQIFSDLETKILNRTARVGVIGLGYVGLPLAIELAKSGYKVFGVDVAEAKIHQLKEIRSYIMDVSNEDLQYTISNGLFEPTNDFSVISSLDAVSICVPTPLTKNEQPDMSYIISAVEQIKKYVHKGLLIILESTTYPGTTEELIEKELEKMGYVVGKDYFLCFSPERVDPGNKKYNTKNTPKVIGGTTQFCIDLSVKLYQNVIETIVPVSSPKVAEMSKLLENTFRSINIAFVNEMAMLCDKLGISIWETIGAASTKPFGFMPFYPGPGIGGHCIPLDPMYLAWKARGVNFYSRFIELAQEINKHMPDYVVSKVAAALNDSSKAIKGSKILILGLAYKPNVDDLRESPGLEIYEHLLRHGAIVEFNDPHAKSFIDSNGFTIQSIELNYNNIDLFDCVLLLTSHSFYNYKEIASKAKLIIDTRDGFRGINQDNIYRIGDKVPTSLLSM